MRIEGEGEGGMWSCLTLPPACLEPTRTDVGSPGAKIESKETKSVGLKEKSECERKESGADQMVAGKCRRKR